MSEKIGKNEIADLTAKIVVAVHDALGELDMDRLVQEAWDDREPLKLSISVKAKLRETVEVRAAGSIKCEGESELALDNPHQGKLDLDMGEKDRKEKRR